MINLITIPENMDVLTQKILPLEIECNDPAGGDCDILITVENVEVAHSKNSVSTSIDLSEDIRYHENSFPFSLSNDPKAYLGRLLQLKIMILSSTGINMFTEIRTFYTEDPEIWTRVKDFTGRIVDFDGDRVLVVHPEKEEGTKNDKLTIEKLQSNDIKEIELDVTSNFYFRSPTLHPLAFLIPEGVIYTTLVDNKGLLKYWDNLGEHELGFLDNNRDTYIPFEYDFLSTSESALVVKGDYVLFGSNDKLWLHQFSTEMTTQIGSDRKKASDILQNNDDSIAYWCKGIVDTVNDSTCRFSYYYTLNTNSGVDMSILLSLDEEYRNNISSLNKTNNGWAAFSQGNEIWIQDPNGSTHQITDLGSNSPDEFFQIEELSSDGQIVFSYPGQDRHLGDTSDQTMFIGSREGRVVNINQSWYKLLGRSIFRLAK